MNTVALIIPAAGKGKRLDHDVPKPFISFAGKTILEHTLSRFLPLEELEQVVIAASGEYRRKATTILAGTEFQSIETECVEGGEERQHSIRNALLEVKDVDLVAVHDAVRPFIATEVIRRCMTVAAETDGAVVGIRAKDTVKKVNREGDIVETPERNFLWQAQTPQIFKKEILTEAYVRAFEEGFVGTDDSSLVERLGYRVKMIEGNRDNIKITYPADLQLAGLLLEERS